MSENIVIGIEGLVGAGKTSICRELLKHIPNSILLNGGNLYRAILSVLLKKESDIKMLACKVKNVDIKEIMNDLKIEIKIENNETVFYCDKIRLDEEDLQSVKSSMAVSTVGGMADNSNLFYFARELINDLKKKYNIIVSGRALMKIYPDLDYHFFITASLEQRVSRKLKQYEYSMTKKEMETHISKRDLLQEKAGFYNLSDKTITIDVTECKSVKESTKKVLGYIIIPVA